MKTGAEVTWVNHDDIPHNVISTNKSFASPVLDTDEKFSYTFTKPGEFPYYCSIHPHMTGKVMARERRDQSGVGHSARRAHTQGSALISRCLSTWVGRTHSGEGIVPDEEWIFSIGS